MVVTFSKPSHSLYPPSSWFCCLGSLCSWTIDRLELRWHASWGNGDFWWGGGDNTIIWEYSLSWESLLVFKIVTVIAIRYPISVLLHNRKFPTPPTPLPPLFLLSDSQCRMAQGASCWVVSQGYGSCCFSFMMCTHPTLLEGARC